MPRKSPAVLRQQSVALFLLLSVAGLGTAAAREEPIAKTEDPSSPADSPTDDGFQQLLPRGAIAALVDPEFVTAAEAEIPDDAWILGFAHGGEAYAYDLNLLNSHEVVNHRVAGSAFAAVW